MPKKGFRLEVFLRFKVFSEKNLFLKNYVTLDNSPLLVTK